MSVSSISFPTPTFFGADALDELPAHLRRLNVRKPLVVTDSGLVSTDAFTRLEQVLGRERRERGWWVYAGVHSNPIEADVIEAAEAFRGYGCDGMIAFGGGSALDAGKAARLLIKRPEFHLSDLPEEPDWSGFVPCVAISTTAGTGSEVGRSSVITLTATGRKAVLFHADLMADLVILDPVLTVGLPPGLTAATGVDALTHCIESYTCPVFHPLCDGIALEGIHLIAETLPTAYREGADLDARGKMLMAAAMGGVAFQKDLGVVHSLAHPLSTICGMHHGLANALCLVAGMKFCAERKPGLYRRVGTACGLEVLRCSEGEADRGTIRFVADFIAGLGITGRLRDHGVAESQVDALVVQATEDPCHATNAVPVTSEDFRRLYLEVL